MKASFGLSLAIVVFLCIACGNETEKNKAFLTGYWSVQKAFRDSRETRLLNGVFFHFSEAGKMHTNLPNTAENDTDYELKEGQITQKLPEPVVYRIQNLADSSLVLAFEMNNTMFELHMKKLNGPPPPDSTQQE